MEHLSPEAIKVIGICIIFVFAGLASMILGLLDHQRKMAEILRADRKQSNGLDERVDALQNEIRELKSMLTAQTPQRPNPDELQQRVG